jgi:hypothetical protein
MGDILDDAIPSFHLSLNNSPVNSELSLRIFLAYFFQL